MNHNPFLLTPGPLTTSVATKAAMLDDWGSWDDDFNQITSRIGEYLLACAGAEDTHSFVPMQGSGTFAVEAALGSLIKPTETTLVLVNGAYGQRMVSILKQMDRPVRILDTGEYKPPTPAEVTRVLDAHPDIAAVAMVHCETSSGILNPVDDIARQVQKAGKVFILDSMSAFGAVPLDARQTPFTALVSSANKCFEGVPGFGFVLVDTHHLTQCVQNSPSLSLDLFAQWRYMQSTGQWRFTPPTHSVVAFSKAIDQHQQEGGIAGRHQRYLRNRQRLVAGMRRLGFQTLLSDEWLSPIITTFLSPDHPCFDFTRFYQLIKQKGFIIYPGKLTQCESFRLGNIGQLFDEEIDAVLVAIENANAALGIPANVIDKVKAGTEQ